MMKRACQSGRLKRRGGQYVNVEVIARYLPGGLSIVMGWELLRTCKDQGHVLSLMGSGGDETAAIEAVTHLQKASMTLQ